MKTQKNFSVRAFIVSTVLVSLLCPMPPPLLAARSPEPLAEVEVAASLVTFQPQISYSQVRVTVTGPKGFESIETFGADETPAIVLPGNDGLYKYELRFSPVLDPQALERLARARQKGIDLRADKASDKRTVQRGWFSLADGSVVPDLVEPQPKVVLTNGDGVIRNSLCVGFDCPDAPLFDDSTILLMENNTRVKFGDTSDAPFPNNDWEIEANSSLSGGASYLGFNDCGSADNDGGCATDLVFAVESGARQSALYVESDGDIGIGTSNPVLDLHIVTGNSPALRLDQDGSSGFSPQVWDIAGNEASFFVRDVTGGSLLPLRIRPGAPTSSIDIAASGNVGVGTASPTTELHVFRPSTAANLRIQGTGAGIFLESSAAPANDRIAQFFTSSGGVFRIRGLNDALSQDVVGLALNLNSGAVGINTATPNASAALDVNGAIFQRGLSLHADYVFEESYQLESIEAHAAAMRELKRLPAVPGRQVDSEGLEVLEIGAHRRGMLEELEKAHLYIEQLHSEIQALREEIRNRGNAAETLAPECSID